MTPTHETELTPDLIDRVKRLSAGAKERLRELLDAEADDPAAVRRAWSDELAKRIADIDSGAVTLIPADEVFAAARRRLADTLGTKGN